MPPRAAKPSTPPTVAGRRDSATMNQRFIAFAFCRADLVVEVDADLGVAFAAGPTSQMLGRTPEEMIGLPFLDIIHGGDRRMAEQMLKAAGRQGRIEDVVLRLNGAQGRAPTVAVAGYRVPDMNNHFFLALKVEPVKTAYTQPKDMVRDAKTGVLESDSFGEVAAQRVHAFERAGGEAKISLVKVGNLKSLEATLDGEQKDELLSAIGSILKEQSLGGDTAGRLDDEHYSLVHDADADIDAVGRRIEEKAAAISPGGPPLSSTTATIEANGTGLSEDQVAKAIMYTMQKFYDNKGKVAGASLAGMLSNMTANTMRTVETFKTICRTGNFEIVFMPICDLRTGKVHHFEALSRFYQGVEGGTSPYQLITLAEEVGIISEFDLAVARKGVKAVRELSRYRELPKVAINVSGYSIGNPAYLKRLHEIVNADPNLPNLLMFEITESAKIEDLETVNNVIQGLRTRGFEVCLDDFGAGAASFDYLNMLEVDVVKFDGPVVNRAFSTDKGSALLTSMATMCRKTGVETVAEMVENAELASFLIECGVDYGQGYYYGKPDKNPFSFLAAADK